MNGSPSAFATNAHAAKLWRQASSAIAAYFAQPTDSMSRRKASSNARHFASSAGASRMASASIASNDLPPRRHQSTSSVPKNRTFFTLS